MFEPEYMDKELLKRGMDEREGRQLAEEDELAAEKMQRSRNWWYSCDHFPPLINRVVLETFFHVPKIT